MSIGGAAAPGSSFGHAYETATQWRKHRPKLEPGAAAPPIDTAPHGPPATLDESYRAFAESCAERARLNLSAEHMALLLESTPSALALVGRLRRDHDLGDEMASAFTLP